MAGEDFVLNVFLLLQDHPQHDLPFSNAGAHAGFNRGGANTKGDVLTYYLYYLAKKFRKMHKIEYNWTERGASVQNSTIEIRHCNCNVKLEFLDGFYHLQFLKQWIFSI